MFIEDSEKFYDYANKQFRKYMRWSEHCHTCVAWCVPSY